MLKYEIERCYGCEACHQICSVGAIQMITNHEGFLYPRVDANLCINCNLCNKVCPIIEENFNQVLNPKSDCVYAGWNKLINKISESSSGGVFAVVAEYIISNKGVVYGCVWNQEQQGVFHARITESIELIKLKGSKYIQSKIGDVYIQIKADLKEKKLVLFSGTPCQVAGLKLFLQNSYENLFTIDLVCHGVPSPLMFKEYVEWLKRKKKISITNFRFRDRKPNDMRAYVSWMENGIKRMFLVGLQPYTYGFYKSYLNRESCYRCSFSSASRAGDITLSDFWGAEKYHEELINARLHGFNMIACNTEKGKEMLECIKPYISVVESKLEYAVNGDVRLRHAEVKPSIRNVIYKQLQNEGFGTISDRYLMPRFVFIHKYSPNWIKKLIKRCFK